MSIPNKITSNEKKLNTIVNSIEGNLNETNQVILKVKDVQANQITVELPEDLTVVLKKDELPADVAKAITNTKKLESATITIDFAGNVMAHDFVYQTQPVRTGSGSTRNLMQADY